MKVIFFIALYFMIMFLEKRDNHLCGAVLGLVAGMGNDGDLDECSDCSGVSEIISVIRPIDTGGNRPARRHS